MTAPRSVWVLVWPDGGTDGTFQTYDAAKTMHARIGDPTVVIIRYDIAGLRPDVPVASASPLPSAAPTADVASASPQGPVAVPAGDGGGHDTATPRSSWLDAWFESVIVNEPIGVGGYDVTTAGGAV